MHISAPRVLFGTVSLFICIWFTSSLDVADKLKVSISCIGYEQRNVAGHVYVLEPSSFECVNDETWTKAQTRILREIDKSQSHIIRTIVSEYNFNDRKMYPVLLM